MLEIVFYIHIADPGFPDPPFPGERRFGPYLTLEEATAQAVSDAALGFGVALGIYEEAESEKREPGFLADDSLSPQPSKAGKVSYSRSQIEKRALTMQRRLRAEALAAAQADEATMRAMLPDGLAWADLQRLATETREAQAAEASRRAS